jgi:hypothetical protein
VQPHRLVKHEQEVPVAEASLCVHEELVAEGPARVLRHLIAVQALDVHGVAALENTRHRAAELPEEAPEILHCQPIQVDEDTGVLVADVPLELVKHRGLARSALAVQHDDVVAVAPREGPGNKVEDVVSAEEHLRPSDWTAGDVGVDRVHYPCATRRRRPAAE